MELQTRLPLALLGATWALAGFVERGWDFAMILWPRPLLSPEHLNMPLEKKKTPHFFRRIFFLQADARPSADVQVSCMI